MAKKDFSGATADRVYSRIEEVTAPETPAPVERTPYSDEAAREMRLAMTTQGRKGCRAIRLNMAFAPDVHEYIKVMSQVRGQSMAKFTNEIIRQSMEQNKELYEKAREFANGLKSLAE